ncbi:MAG: hypothetical protein R3B46_00545 [Phycisphaerales bacterium]
MRSAPKYLLFASLGLLLLAGVQFVVALIMMCFWSGDLGFDLLVNVWRYPLLAVFVAMLAIAVAGLTPKPRSQGGGA